MKKKKAVSLLALLMIVLMLLSLIMSIVPISAFALSESDIEAVRQQRDELSTQVEEIQERIDSLKEEHANVLEQKTALDEKNRLANEQLALVAEEISYYDGLIAEKSSELEKAMNREEEQLQLYRARVRAMEERGSYNILALVLHSGSFSDFLASMEDMGEIMASDRELEEQYIAAREETAEIKESYEAERAEYEGHQTELREEQQQIEQEIQDAYDELSELEEDIERAEQEYEAACAQEASSAAQIQRMLAQYNAEQRAKQQLAQQQAQANGGGWDDQADPNGDGVWDDNDDGWGDNWNTGSGDNSGGGTDSGWDAGSSGIPPSVQSTGSFVWPVPCSTRVTGRFNEPRAGHLHAGIDIDGYGNDGAGIVAADGGVVIVSSYDSTYGNYVIIDHGNAIQTVYAHNSGNAVKVGDTVSQGQVIAYLGATGNATGTHCHFEIHINDSLVDPASYFSGLTYYQC